MSDVDDRDRSRKWRLAVTASWGVKVAFVWYVALASSLVAWGTISEATWLKSMEQAAWLYFGLESLVLGEYKLANVFTKKLANGNGG
ncbi:MAG: hypothetical protein GY906_11705 [bacterium]|nr:hypothetical protein [bacterium]